MPKVNPAVLAWARETSGLSPEEAAKKLDIRAVRGVEALDRLDALETGKAVPTQKMLIRMAKCYRRPLVALYLRDVPPKGPDDRDFRRLPEIASRRDAGLVDAVVRDISSRQSIVRASIEAAGEEQPLAYVGSVRPEDGVTAAVDAIKDSLGFDMEKFRGTESPRKSFDYLRSLAESKGMFVILIDNLGSPDTKIKVEMFRGFALVDEVAPFIAVNINDSASAWSFTLAQEIAHVWAEKTQIGNELNERKAEEFCGEVASHMLLSADEIDDVEVDSGMSEDEIASRISHFAKSRRVGSAMVAHRLHRANAISRVVCENLAERFKKALEEQADAERGRDDGLDGGPDDYVVRRHRIGKALIDFVDRMMKEEGLSVTKAGKVFGVRALNVHALIERGRPQYLEGRAR